MGEGSNVALRFTIKRAGGRSVEKAFRTPHTHIHTVRGKCARVCVFTDTYKATPSPVTPLSENYTKNRGEKT